MEDGRNDPWPPRLPAHRLSSASALQAGGFTRFAATASNGHDFEIWLQAPTGARRLSWQIAVVSRGTVCRARAYVTAGVMRASVPIADPIGHLLFQAGVEDGCPTPSDALRCEFGTL